MNTRIRQISISAAFVACCICEVILHPLALVTEAIRHLLWSEMRVYGWVQRGLAFQTLPDWLRYARPVI